MIRFQPDSWWEGLLRPIYMMASSAWVYVELLAPDFRFALFFAALAAALASLRWRKGLLKALRCDPFWPLTLFFLVCATAWVATTGNGRYFMSGMILIGVLLVAAISRIPLDFGRRVLILFLVFALQWLAVAQNSPWARFDSYEWVPWREASYFEMESSDLGRYDGAVMVTLQAQTFSAIAPIFPHSVRWVNLSVFEGADLGHASSRFGKVDRILRGGGRVYVMQRTLPSEADESGIPSTYAISEMGRALRRYGIVLRGRQSCGFLHSPTIERMTLLASTKQGGESNNLLKRAGFWLCEASYSGWVNEDRMETAETKRVVKMFSDLEAACPRLFPPGQVGVRPHSAGFMRIYSASDSGVVFERETQSFHVKYERSLNPQRIGTHEDVMRMKQTGCAVKFIGRGSPWSWID